ncbi:MAG: alpha-amylase family glycosyl hydrolase, partial [Bacteroidota bacterium]
MKKTLLFLAMILSISVQAQIITTIPAFPTVGDDITLIYDASEGNGALEGVVPVYAHMGLITENSNGPSDWQYVQGNWGTADPNVFMTPIGNNRHQIQFTIPDFFGIDTTQETVMELAFVFRNVNGSVVGREADGSDIFYEIFPSTGAGLFVNLTPDGPEIVELNDVISISGNASLSATLTLFEDNVQIAQTTGTEINYDLTVSAPGSHTVKLVADNGNTTVEDEFTYVVNPTVNTVSLPTLNSKLGVNYLSPTSVRLVLHAPLKNYVYVLGTFNDFTPDANYFMNRTPSGETWWIDITGLTAGETYAFQYFVDGAIKVADPFSELILDPSNDNNIDDPETFPNLPAYPDGASGALTVITPGATPYNWQIDNFQRPEKTDLVIYELLVRDFIAAHDYDTLLDSLDYLANLGVNAIQFMPIQEFEGNISWGYNPSFHMAVDKYYGTPDQLKAFIDAAHARGMAVILDVVFNHVFSQSPLAQLWWNSAGFRPATNNPYLNEYPTHPFNVGYDVNHESQAAKDWMDRVVQHWITEYKFDGFRFD